MEDDQAKADFRKSSVLYEMGRYQESMHILTSLDRAFPNNPDVLYPLARCMAKQGWVEDALEICVRLEALCRHPKARKLQKRIIQDQERTVNEARATPNIVELEGIADFSQPKWMYALPVVGFILLVLLGAVLFGNKDSDLESWEQPTIEINQAAPDRNR